MRRNTSEIGLDTDALRNGKPITEKFKRHKTQRIVEKPKTLEEMITQQYTLNLAPVFDKDQIVELFQARCADLKIQIKDWQLKKFEAKVDEMSCNRKLNLTNMMIGPQTAQLLSNWIISNRIEITHLILSNNNLGDEGVHILA